MKNSKITGISAAARELSEVRQKSAKLARAVAVFFIICCVVSNAVFFAFDWLSQSGGFSLGVFVCLRAIAAVFCVFVLLAFAFRMQPFLLFRAGAWIFAGAFFYDGYCADKPHLWASIAAWGLAGFLALRLPPRATAALGMAALAATIYWNLNY